MRQALAVDVTGLLDEVARLKQRVDALERAHRPRDREDAALRRQIAESTGGRWFRSTHLLDHAREDPALGRALAAATLQSSGEVGAWLRAQRQVSGDDVHVLRRGKFWRVVAT